MKPSQLKQTIRDARPRTLFLLCCGWLACSPPVFADWHTKLGFLSEYIYRGYSKSNGNPVGQGQMDYQNDAGGFAGIGLSQVDFERHGYPSAADLEARPYLGWRVSASQDWQAEFSATGYIYDGKVFAKTADYVEFSAALHYLDALSGRISVAPDAYQRQATVVNYELDYRRDILDTVQLSAGLGYTPASPLLNNNYLYWNVGGSWFLTPNIAIDVRYVDVDVQTNGGGQTNSVAPEPAMAYPYGQPPAHYSQPPSNYGQFQPKLLTNHYLISISVGF